MKQNLDSLRTEIVAYLEAEGFAVFYGSHNPAASNPTVVWDTLRYPDFRAFVATARAAGVKLITLSHLEFSPADVDDAIDRLDDGDFSPEERVALERRLRDMRIYQGLTCELHLSFDHQGRVYAFGLQTDWHLDFLDILDEIDSSVPERGEEEEGPIGGYFSRN